MRSIRIVTIVCALASVHLDSATSPIDGRQSRLRVFVYKAGLFSAFADDHVIEAPIQSGTMTDSPPAARIEINAADLKVLDPSLDAGKREEVRARMVGKEVLDATTFPRITFESTAIEPAGPGKWNVSGRLTIHGVTRAVTLVASSSNGHYRGATTIKQRDFGIEPIRIVGGTVRVKDEVKIEFDIVAAPASTP